MAKASTVHASHDDAVSHEGAAWLRLHARVTHVMDDFFYSMGYWIATHTKTILAISLAGVLCSCLGFFNFVVETNWGNLWVPANSLAKQHEDIVLRYYDEKYDFAVILFESPSGSDGNVLTKDAFDKVWEIHRKVLALETEDGTSFADICAKDLDGMTCRQPSRGVTRFWVNDFAVYEDTVKSDEDLLDAINVDQYPDGQTVNVEALFGNSITFGRDGEVERAATMSQDYWIASASEGAAEKEAMDWMSKFVDLLEEEANVSHDTFNVVYFTARSIDDALKESVTGEIFLFLATYCIMVVFVTIIIGRCFEGSVRRRSWLALAGIALVVAAAIAAYGSNSAFGVPFTSLSQILPFILIGIGVDDMFVIVASFDHTDPSLPVEQRTALALKRCGVSITYTSLTNMFAFALGSLSVLPAVEYFCLYAAIAILFDFVLQMTAFVAFVTMDARRQKAGRMDWCCCFINHKFLEKESMPRGVDLAERERSDAPSAVPDGESRELSGLGRWLKSTYVPLILSVPGKIFVLTATAGLLAAGIYGATQASSGFALVDLMPDVHHARDYSELGDQYQITITNEYIPLGIYTREVDYTDEKVQAQIQATDIQMEDKEFIVGPLDSWLASFLAWAAENAYYSDNIGTSGNFTVYADRETFYEALAAFIHDEENKRFLSDIVFADNNTIVISRTELYLVNQTTTDNYLDALEDARHVMHGSFLIPEPFAFSTTFIFTEQFLVIYTELLTNFLLALMSVAILSIFALGQMAVVVLVCLTVVIVDVELLGFVYHWGLEINSITAIELIMSVGLVVDYMVHIVHYFLHQDPTADKEERIAAALGEIGPSVVIGAATTFLGIMPMAFASSFIFQVFFRMFLIIIAFGLFHGLAFIPVALSLIPDRCMTIYTAQSVSKA